MSSIKIYLDNYQDACYPGQTIAGRVECYFHSETSLRAIRLKFRGRAKTEWEETERHYNHDRKEYTSTTVPYNAIENYFDAEYNLVQGGEDFHLPAGTHKYPFSYILPPRLPSSFEGSYGNIRYHIKATVDCPWTFDYEDKFHLNVVAPLDLNYVPGIRDSIASAVDKTMCSCWCNDSGALAFTMSLPVSGFAAGQEINIGGYIENMTNVNAEKVKFKIVGKIEFMVHHPSTKTKFDDVEIAKCVERGVGAHGEKSWTSILKLPSHVPNLIPCSIININYHLKAKVVVPCPHTNLENEIPVVIGTVPLAGVRTTFSGGPPPEMPFTIPSDPPTEGSPLLPNIPAPYPGGGASPYPAGGNIPHPPSGNAPYPPSRNASYSPGGNALYPQGGNVPHPPGRNAPYPPGGNAPYPPDGNAPYPPGGNVPYPPGGNVPYPPGGNALYPPGGNAPYLPGSSTPISPNGNSAPYPPGGRGNLPYPSEDTKVPFGGSSVYPGGFSNSSMDSKSPSAPPEGAPYPSGGAPYPPAGGVPYPPSSSLYSSPVSIAPPSYEEAKNLKEKS